MSNPCSLRSLLLLALAPVPAAAQGDAVVLDSGTPFYFAFNDLALSSSPLSPTLTMNGDVSLSMPEVEICLGTDTSIPSSCAGGAAIEASLKLAMALELAADSSGAFSKRLPLGEVLVAYVSFPAASWVTGAIVLKGDLVFEGEVEAGMRTALVAQLQIDGHMTAFTRSEASYDRPHDMVFEYSPPTLAGNSSLTLSARLEARLSVELQINGIPAGGPYLGVTGGVALIVDPLNDPWWTAQAIVRPVAGWDTPFGPGPALATSTQRWPFADAGGPLAAWIEPPARWSRSYDHASLEFVKSAAVLDDGFVMVGSPSVAGAGAYITRLDGEGNVLWEQAAQGISDAGSHPTDVYVLPAGQIAIGASVGASSGARLDLLQPDGTPLWTREYLDAAGETLELSSLIPTHDGGFAFAGTVRRGTVRHPIIVKLDRAGVAEWASEFALDASIAFGSSDTNDLVETPDGRLVVAGIATVYGRDAILVAFEADGSFAWANAYGGPGYDYSTSLCVLDGGDLLLGGKINSFDNSSWYARVDRQGQLQWSKCVGSEGDTQNDLVRGVTAVPGGALLVGTTRIGDATEAWIARVDLDGDTVWFKSLRAPYLDHLEGVLRLENGLLAWGKTWSVQPLGTGGDESDRWIVRAAHDGMLHFDVANGFDAYNDVRGQTSTPGVIGQPLPGLPVSFGVVPDTQVQAFDPVTSTVTLLTD